MRPRTLAPLAALIPALTLASVLGAQTTPVEMGHQARVQSEILDEERDLLVYLPPRYESDEEARYPVIYVLDGRPSFRFVAGLVHGLGESGAIPRHIVVGITNTDRWRDLTPAPTLEHDGTGGGDAFLRFLEDEVIPFVDAEYRTNDYRVFAGHSLGGLMVLHALYSMPDTFDGYLALSPSLELRDGELLGQLAELFASRDRLDAHLHVGLGDERRERAYIRRLETLLEDAAPPGLDWTSKADLDLNHMEVRVPGFLDGMLSIYRAWNLSSHELVEMTDAEIAAFYARASVKYETPHRLSFDRLIEAGYFGVAHRSTAERGLALLRRAVELEPESAYAHDSLGEGYERTGQLEKAREQFELAWSLVKEHGHFDPGYFKAHLERIYRKLGVEKTVE